MSLILLGALGIHIKSFGSKILRWGLEDLLQTERRLVSFLRVTLGSYELLSLHRPIWHQYDRASSYRVRISEGNEYIYNQIQ